eukprot:gene9173-16842_t
MLLKRISLKQSIVVRSATVSSLYEELKDNSWKLEKVKAINRAKMRVLLTNNLFIEPTKAETGGIALTLMLNIGVQSKFEWFMQMLFEIAPLNQGSTRDDGSSLFNACSQALFGDKSLARCLRGLTSIELFLHSSYYETHPLIKSPQAIEVYSRSTENALQNIVSDRALKYYKEKCFESLVDAEASIVANDYSSSSFLSMLALSSATDVVIESYYPISTLAGDNESEVESRNGRELLFNSTILPRGSSSSSNTKIHIFRCTSSESKFPENKDYYVPLLQMSEDALETGSGKLVRMERHVLESHKDQISAQTRKKIALGTKNSTKIYDHWYGKLRYKPRMIAFIIQMIHERPSFNAATKIT